MKRIDMGKIPISADIDLVTLEQLSHLLGICLFKLNLRTMDISLTVNTTHLSGYEYNEVPRDANSKDSMIFPEDKKLYYDSMRSIIHGINDYYHIEYRMYRKDMSIVWIEEIGLVCEYDEDGGPLCIAGIALDLSREKLGEEKAQKTEMELRRFLNDRNDDLAAENHLLHATSRACTLIVGGFHADYEMTLRQSIQLIAECMGVNYVGLWRNAVVNGKMHCFLRTYWSINGHKLGKENNNSMFLYDDILPSWRDELSEDKFANLLSKNVPAQFLENCDFTKDTTNIMFVPYHLNGEFWGIIGFARNENRQFFEYEARAIKVGTGVIACSISRNEALGKINLDRDQAIANTLAKGEFLSRMSHELRTPLNAIISMTNFALKEKDYQKALDHIKKANASSQLLLNVVNDILDISKIEAGKLAFTIEPFSFATMLQNADDIVRVNMEAKHQNFTITGAKDITNLVISDEHRLLQVIVNLLNNAMKFTPEHGNISLTVSQRKIGNDQLRIRVEVKDDGIGMTYEQQKRLFQVFEQADGGITRKYGGSGLGLAICKKILNALGGDIWVKSKPNQGSCFYFEITAGLGEIIEEIIKANKSEPEIVETANNFHGCTILLAEDVEINREIIEIMLEDTEIKIVNAENGQIALDKFSEDPLGYDLILMDVQMPIMDGITATKRIRESNAKNAKSIPIVAMTANAFKEDIDVCLAAGMNDHIGKPINMEYAFNILRKYLKSKN